MFSRMLFVLTIASFAVVGFAAWQVLDKPVRSFVIEGDLTAMEQVEVHKVLTSGRFGGVLSTDLAVVTKQLSELAWAREVSVRRHWPDKLAVSLQRAKPVARWGEDQYVSAYGDLLTLPDEYAGLPQFMVEVSNPQQAMEVYRLLDQISAREALTISRLNQNAQGEWTVELLKGPRLLLGAEQLNERMHRFLLVYRRVLQDGTKIAQYVDARYANGVAVRFVNEGQDEMLVAQNSTPRFAEGND